MLNFEMFGSVQSGLKQSPEIDTGYNIDEAES